MLARTNEELGDALKSGENQIEIEGDLAKKVITIKVSGQVAWAVALGAIAVAVIALIATLGAGGASAPVGADMALAATPATASIGTKATVAAIIIAVVAGGIGILTRLHSGYRIVKKDNGRVILTKM